jgi:hypothetical protein
VAAFSLFNEQPHDLGSNLISNSVFRHPSPLNKNQLDSAYHYNDSFGMFVRRIGPDPHAGGAQTYACHGCPDIWELASGDFAVIGTDITDLAEQLPSSASCGPDERIVRIPRKTLVLAKTDIPDRL